MPYIDIAKNILKENIKSAIYIDENAKEFGQDEKTLTGAPEEELSVKLYQNFKETGVSLETIKYKANNENEPSWMSYCLDNRDLFILDWHLDRQTGEVQSLKILNEIINTPNIHFCVIYTSENNLDNVFKRIITNYSGIEPDKYFEIKELCEVEFGENFNYADFDQLNLNRNVDNIKKELVPKIQKEHSRSIQKIKNLLDTKDALCAIIKASIVNLDTYHQELNHPLPCPSFINYEKYILEINNTIITIFKKSEIDPSVLLEKFYDHIIGDIDSFNQLLTIEFFNKIYKTGIINKNNSINFKKETLLYHRHKLKDEGLDSFFEEFIKELLFEKLNLSIRESKSKLLSDEIFDELFDPESKPKDEDRQRMNVFYNSLTLDKRDSYINFGDVFQFKDENTYLICLTPLCDCLRPQDKIKRNYFFAEGEHISIQDALKVGDTAFISFLPNGKVVRWTEAPNEASKFVPIYIKPIQYKVLENKDKINEANEIDLWYLNKEGEPKMKTVRYLTTIRQNYAQRIANHAFAYPIRVGVDFVKS